MHVLGAFFVTELAAEVGNGGDYTGAWITGGAGTVAAVLLFVGGIVTRRMRGPTPYEALAARLESVEEAQRRDSRHIRILSHALDVVWRHSALLREQWGKSTEPPALSDEDERVVQLARDLQTYGDVLLPNEPARN